MNADFKDANKQFITQIVLDRGKWKFWEDFFTYIQQFFFH